MKGYAAQILELQRAKGTLNKQKVLEKYQYDSNFKKALKYALDPFITYNVSESTISKELITESKCPQIQPFSDILVACEQMAVSLSTIKYSDRVQALCNYLRTIKDSEEQELYIKLISKTLRLGVTGKTVNKIIPDLINVWEVQQAYPYEKYPIEDNAWFVLTQKLNGVRATYYRGNLYARSGEMLTNLNHIIDDIKVKLPDKMIYDGELLLKPEYAEGLSDNEAFRKVTGIVNSDCFRKTEVYFVIFDTVNEEEFDCGESSIPYSMRRTILNIIRSNSFSENIDILTTLYQGTDQSKIDEWLDKMVEEDKEGLMINLDVPYKRKRHKGILKAKRFYTMDLEIVGTEEGTGRLSNTLGALVLKYKDNTVKVGSGFTDDQRKEYWQNKDNLIGKICEVKYKEISKDKSTGAESLQFPVFVALRWDKLDANYE